MPLYRLRPERAGEVFQTLHELRHIHPYFVGYLGVVRAATAEKKKRGLLTPVHNLFNDYLSVEGGPGENYPYVKLFQGSARGVKHPAWQNKNISGTYGMSGRKDELRRVLILEKQGNRDVYGLPKGHTALALENWVSREPVPVHPLALFLYRDLAFDLDTPATSAWVERFQEEFGYLDKAGAPTADYSTLFSEDADAYAPAEDWLTLYDPKAIASTDYTPDDDPEA